MQTPLPPLTTAGIDVQEGGLCVRLSFSFQHPEFSTPLAERPTYDARLPEEIGRADAVAVELAAASAPLLLQAFEQAQSVVERSSIDLRLAQIKALQAENPIVKEQKAASTITNISPREQALINALKAIVAETMAYPATRPQSAESYLPEDMVLAGISALGGYGVTLTSYREVA